MSYLRSVLDGVNCFTCSSANAKHVRGSFWSEQNGDECATSSFWYLRSNSVNPLFTDPNRFFGDVIRMRNGNFIEYTLDSENKDETCSIVSSNNHQLTGFLGGSSRSSVLLKPCTVPDNISTTSSGRSNRSTVYSTTGGIIQPNNSSSSNSWQSGMMSSVTSNSLIYSSSSFPATSCTITATTSITTVVTTTATTVTSSSSLSSNSFSSANWAARDASQMPTIPSNVIMSKQASFGSSNALTTRATIHVYYPVRSFTEISISPQTTAFDVIYDFLTSQLFHSAATSHLSQQSNSLNRKANIKIPYINSYALRLICRSLNPNDHCWLHPTQNVQKFLEQNQNLLEKGWKIELRIRYVPFNLDELFKNDFVTFKLLYEQILEDFLLLEFPANCLLSVQDAIIELGCLELRRTNRWQSPQALEKNSILDSPECDFHKFLPASFISSMKPKQLRKLLKNKFKKICLLPPESIMISFLNLVSQFVNFRRELFHCSLGESSWCVPVDLMIGSDVGIAYFTSNSSPANVIVKSFELIEQIQIVSHATISRTVPVANSDKIAENGDGDPPGATGKKILLNIRIKNEDDMLVLSCSSFSMAQSIADLIDGYHRLATNSRNSIWANIINSEKNGIDSTKVPSSAKSSGQSSLKSNVSEIIEPRMAQFEFITPQISSFTIQDNTNTVSSGHTDVSTSKSSVLDDHPEDSNQNGDDGDYSNPMENCLEIYREKLRIDELVGKGQFGDVHKGLYFKPIQDGNSEEESIPVAIKISRVQNDTLFGRSDIFSADQKLLCEAERMHKLDHSNIIKLIGVCSDSPVYIVMELAHFGELRDFLQKHGSSLEERFLIQYSYQIASAMSYLESKQFVHRDIAARNVLVFSFECVKLADFGLSRYIEDASYYMSTNSKLPIKWMAPESINFRRFTTSSDVWMFAVCMWEIFMLGKKPFQGVKNCDVIGLIECGDRLTKPLRCPDSLYQLMLKCWRYEPEKRPSFRYIKQKIQDIYQGELGLVGAIARMEISNDTAQSSPQSSLSSLSTYHDRSQSYSNSSSMSRTYHKDDNLLHKKLVTESSENNLSQFKSNLSLTTSQSNILDSNKIKAILSEQRKQMEEDQRWLAQNEMSWQKNRFDSLSRSCSDNSSEHNSTSTSNYEDAHSSKNGDLSSSRPDNLFAIPNVAVKSNVSNESYNSFESTKSSFANSSPSSSLSLDSNSTACGLSVSLKKFFKHNHLTDAKVRHEMMKNVSCSSANLDRKDDTVYWNTINVVNCVRHLLKGVQEVNTEEYVDLVKNVGFELRNLLANVDVLLASLPEDTHRNIGVAQKKLSTNMNDLVESMKKTIMYSDTPMEGAYKQNMLESAYILVIDSKNLLDTIDEARMSKPVDILDSTTTTTDVCVKNNDECNVTANEDNDSGSHTEIQNEQIYANENVA